jgi:hypothetical protein
MVMSPITKWNAKIGELDSRNTRQLALQMLRLIARRIKSELIEQGADFGNNTLLKMRWANEDDPENSSELIFSMYRKSFYAPLKLASLIVLSEGDIVWSPCRDVNTSEVVLDNGATFKLSHSMSIDTFIDWFVDAIIALGRGDARV